MGVSTSSSRAGRRSQPASLQCPPTRGSWFNAVLSTVWCLGGTASCGRPDVGEVIVTTISGTVFEAGTGGPLPLTVIRTEPPSQQVVTNDDGSYVVSTDVEVGETYRVIASKDGFQPNSASVTVREGENTSVDIVLSEARAQLRVSPSSLAFDATRSALQLTIGNVGEGELSYQVVAPAVSWLLIDPNVRAGTVSAAPAVINVEVERTGLAQGDYTTDVKVISDSGEQTIPVTMSVLGSNDPRLSVDPLSLAFGGTTAEMSFTIMNRGTGTLTWQLFTSAPWASFEPSVGDTTGENDIVVVRVDRDRVPGMYTGEISIQSNDIVLPLPISMVVGDNTTPVDVPLAYTGGSVDGRFATPFSSPRGLAYDGTHIWVGSSTGDLAKLDPVTGDELATFQTGLNGIMDMTADGQGRIWLVTTTGEVQRFSPTTTTLTPMSIISSPKGITTQDDAIVTWEESSLNARDPESFSLESVRSAESVGTLLTLAGLDFVTFVDSGTADAINFVVTLRFMRADLPAQAPERRLVELPIHASRIRGLAAHQSTLWALGDGAGSDADKIVRVRLTP